MAALVPNVPPAKNLPIRSFAPGTPERESLKSALADMRAQMPFTVPCIVNGERVTSGALVPQGVPHDHAAGPLCNFHSADAALVRKAIEGAVAAREEWASLPVGDRVAVIRKAGELATTPEWNFKILAATMLGQGKTAQEAEIDASAETVDFLRFNPQFYEQMAAAAQPQNPQDAAYHRVELRALEGYVAAICPFNFTAISVNLVASPAMCGNVVLWKPSSTAVYSSYLYMQLLELAGMPKGVLQFVPGSSRDMGDSLFTSRDLAGVHFTGSSATFESISLTMAKSLASYRAYPRVAAETGGKDFHVVHESADMDNVVNHTIRAAFGYQGQKCSACSRIYIPKSAWEGGVGARLTAAVKAVTMGPVEDFSNFMGAVIDGRSFAKTRGFLDDHVKAAGSGAAILAGGGCDDTKGWFIEPTLVRVDDPKHAIMETELFGPVLAVYVYDSSWEDVLRLVDSTSPYALTGSVFAVSRYAINTAHKVLRHAAGNFYVNQKCTGAIVGQQPFGGGRKSGNNQKAGSQLNLWNWVSARTVSEALVPVHGETGFAFPHQL